MARLLLMRHAKSEWNKLGLWTGHTDVHLSSEGEEEAKRAGEVLKDTDIHQAFVSELKRTHQTLHHVKEAMKKEFDVIMHGALNERDYGEYTGKNKHEIREQIGEEAFKALRRGWDVHVPGGETLKDVHERVVPYFQKHVMPHLQAGKNTIIVSHGNTLRALVKYLENMSDEAIADFEIATGEVHSYLFDDEGKVQSKEVHSVNL